MSADIWGFAIGVMLAVLLGMPIGLMLIMPKQTNRHKSPQLTRPQQLPQLPQQPVIRWYIPAEVQELLEILQGQGTAGEQWSEVQESPLPNGQRRQITGGR